MKKAIFGSIIILLISCAGFAPDSMKSWSTILDLNGHTEKQISESVMIWAGSSFNDSQNVTKYVSEDGDLISFTYLDKAATQMYYTTLLIRIKPGRAKLDFQNLKVTSIAGGFVYPKNLAITQMNRIRADWQDIASRIEAHIKKSKNDDW